MLIVEPPGTRRRRRVEMLVSAPATRPSISSIGKGERRSSLNWRWAGDHAGARRGPRSSRRRCGRTRDRAACGPRRPPHAVRVGAGNQSAVGRAADPAVGVGDRVGAGPGALAGAQAALADGAADRGGRDVVGAGEGTESAPNDRGCCARRAPGRLPAEPGRTGAQHAVSHDIPASALREDVGARCHRWSRRSRPATLQRSHSLIRDRVRKGQVPRSPVSVAPTCAGRTRTALGTGSSGGTGRAASCRRGRIGHRRAGRRAAAAARARSRGERSDSTEGMMAKPIGGGRSSPPAP